MPNCHMNTPYYKAVQWTGSNEQVLVDWINTVVELILTTEVREDVLHIKYPNTANGFWQIPLNHYLVSPATWEGEVASPYGSVVSDVEFGVRYTVIME